MKQVAGKKLLNARKTFSMKQKVNLKLLVSYSLSYNSLCVWCVCIPVFWRVPQLLQVLCSAGRGGGCLSDHRAEQNGCLSARPHITALHC